MNKDCDCKAREKGWLPRDEYGGALWIDRRAFEAIADLAINSERAKFRGRR